MDSRINKKRLSNFLAYEWIIIIVMVVVSILAMEFLYSAAAIKPTTGQKFKYYLDEGIDSQNYAALHGIFEHKTKNSAFSYDVLEFESETLENKFNVLSVRYEVKDGDVVFSDNSTPTTEGSLSRAKRVLQGLDMYDMDNLYKDSQDYLAKFLTDTNFDYSLAPIEFSLLSEKKIENHFNERMKNDNRLRKGQISAKDEIARIKDLCLQSKAFYDLLTNHPEVVFEVDIPEKDGYKAKKGKFGICIDKLVGDSTKKSPDYYFQNLNNKETNNAADVVLMVFNFKKHQPDLQFESISFINRIVRTCSNFIDHVS